MRKSTSINRLFRKRSSSSLSTSLAGKSDSQEYLKIIEYKQNYPMLMEENRVLKEELGSLKKAKDEL